MLARTGWRRGTTENASIRGIGKATVVGAIMIITGTETVTAIMIVMTAVDRLGNNKMNETRTKMLPSWIAAGQARLHLIAEWPESDRKQTLLKAIRASIHSLMKGQAIPTVCCIGCPALRTVAIRPASPSRRSATRVHGMTA